MSQATFDGTVLGDDSPIKVETETEEMKLLKITVSAEAKFEKQGSILDVKLVDIPPAMDFEGTPAYPAEYTSSLTLKLLYPKETIDLSVAEKYYIQINETADES